MSETKVYNDYFFDEPVFDLHDGGYVPLEKVDMPDHPLNIPAALKPDKVEGNDVYYTITAQEGETQILPGAKTKTWGYNTSLLGQTIVLKQGVHYHVHLVNKLPEVTTFHWHGLNVTGPIVDGGPHAPVYPGGSRDIDFTLDQPAQTDWIHPHPCPNTARQVWNGLAAALL
jgi:Putative multicopper oxidases